MPKKDALQTVAGGPQQGTVIRYFASSELDALSLEAAETALISGARGTLEQVALSISENADGEFLSALARGLLVKHFARFLRKARADKRRDGQLSFPGFEHLPRWIQTEDGKRKRLEDAMYTDLRFHYWGLRKRLSDKRRINARLLEMELLLASMRREQAHKRGMRAGQVLALERDTA